MRDALIEGLKGGDRRALARLLTLAARGEPVTAALPEVPPCRVVAFTGAAGVGKSTLVGRLVEYLRKQGQTVAVLACDPQSPLSGGALLGDRLRMPSGPDDGVFIRSLAAESGQGVVARHLPALVAVLEAFGFANVLIETVGAGQGDTAVRDVADVLVLLMQPESGDDVQGEKAGLLEVVDVIALHKSDLPGVDRAEAELRQGLLPAADRSLPVVRVSGKTGLGIDALWQAISLCPLRRRRGEETGRELLKLTHERLEAQFAGALASGDARLSELIRNWRGGQVQSDQAVEALLKLLGK